MCFGNDQTCLGDGRVIFNTVATNWIYLFTGRAFHQGINTFNTIRDSWLGKEGGLWGGDGRQEVVKALEIDCLEWLWVQTVNKIASKQLTGSCVYIKNMFML